MVEVFGVEDRRAEPLGCREEGGVVIFELVAACEIEASSDISLIDRQERERTQKRQPAIDLLIVEQALAPRDVGEFREALPGNAEKRSEHEFDRDVETTWITTPLRSRVEEDVRVEKAFDLLVRHSFRRGPT